MAAVEQRENPADLTLRMYEDGPFWRWAWLDDNLKVVSEGMAVTAAEAWELAGIVLELLQAFAANASAGRPILSGLALTRPDLEL